MDKGTGGCKGSGVDKLVASDLILVAGNPDTGISISDIGSILSGIGVCSQDCNQIFDDFLGNSSLLSTEVSGAGTISLLILTLFLSL